MKHFGYSNKSKFLKNIIYPLISSGTLQQVYPDKPSHPNQKYVTTRNQTHLTLRIAITIFLCFCKLSFTLSHYNVNYILQNHAHNFPKILHFCKNVAKNVANAILQHFEYMYEKIIWLFIFIMCFYQSKCFIYCNLAINISFSNI